MMKLVGIFNKMGAAALISLIGLAPVSSGAAVTDTSAHFVYSGAITCLIGPITSFSAGVVKETTDKRKKGGYFSGRDLRNDTYGIGAGLLLCERPLFKLPSGTSIFISTGTSVGPGPGYFPNPERKNFAIGFGVEF